MAVLHQSVFKEAAVSLTSRCSKQKGLQIFTNAETTAFPKLIQRESNVFFENYGIGVYQKAEF